MKDLSLMVLDFLCTTVKLDYIRLKEKMIEVQKIDVPSIISSSEMLFLHHLLVFKGTVFPRTSLPMTAAIYPCFHSYHLAAAEVAEAFSL